MIQWRGMTPFHLLKYIRGLFHQKWDRVKNTLSCLLSGIISPFSTQVTFLQSMYTIQVVPATLWMTVYSRCLRQARDTGFEQILELARVWNGMLHDSFSIKERAKSHRVQGQDITQYVREFQFCAPPEISETSLRWVQVRCHEKAWLFWCPHWVRHLGGKKIR